MQLKTPGLIIGGMPDTDFHSEKITLEPQAALYVFSDGVYEIERGDGTVYPIEDFIKTLEKPTNLDQILQAAHVLNGPGPFADDFSIMKLQFT